MNNNSSFISFDNSNDGLIFDDSNHPKFPIKYHNCRTNFHGVSSRSYYIYFYKGMGMLKRQNGHIFSLNAGYAASISENFEVSCKETGACIIIEVFHKKGIYPETNYKAYFYITFIEKTGRLKYIDGCTDSLLIPTVKKGNPCLNHLHFPRNIIQTPHQHPSHRIGIVAKGSGICVTPFGNLPLTEGMIFVIKEYTGKKMSIGLDGKKHKNGTHSFNTSGKTMDVIAFHPESDFGPTDKNHPMLNKTMINGQSASNLDDIHTK